MMERQAARLRTAGAAAGLLGLALLGFVGNPFAEEADGGAQDAALMRIEDPERAAIEMRELPAEIERGLSVANGGVASQDRFAPIAKAVAEAYPVQPTVDAVREAVAAQVDANVGGDLTGAAQRFAETAETVSASNVPKRVSDMSDTPEIVGLADLMAGPELRGEIYLTGNRIKSALALAEGAEPPDWASLPEEKRAEEAERFIAETRDDAGEPSDPTSRAAGIAGGKALLRSRLAMLPEADVATLHAFYASPEGRAKRDALVSAFALRNDAGIKRMLQLLAETTSAR